jgi:hypothetical protein
LVTAVLEDERKFENSKERGFNPFIGLFGTKI